MILKYKPEAVYVGRSYVCRVSGCACAEKETYSGADDGGKGRTETSGENPIGIIKKGSLSCLLGSEW